MIRLDDVLLGAVDSVADEKRWSRSGLIREILWDWYENRSPIKKTPPRISEEKKIALSKAHASRRKNETFESIGRRSYQNSRNQIKHIGGVRINGRGWFLGDKFLGKDVHAACEAIKKMEVANAD